MHHEMQLHPGPFAQMKSGQKKSELRLNDPKRQKIRVGDMIKFTNREDSTQELMVQVTYLNHYRTFKDLYLNVQNDYPTWEEQAFIEGMYQYYSPEDENTYGALEIGVQLI